MAHQPENGSVAPWEPKLEKELRDNGMRIDMNDRGLSILKYIGFEMVISSKMAQGWFVVSERSCQPFGVLHGGTTAHIAESIVSSAGVCASDFQRIAGVELNVNHLRAVPVGYGVVVTATPMLIGKRLQVWEVKFEGQKPKELNSDSEEDSKPFLAAVSRVTLIVGLPLDKSFKEGFLKNWKEGIQSKL